MTGFTWIVVGAALVYVLVGTRCIRAIRHGKDEDFLREWRGLDAQRRRTIQVALRRGLAVDSHDDARLALAAVAQADHVHSAMRPMNAAATLTLVALIVDGALSSPRWLAIAAGAALVLDIGLSVVSYRTAQLRRRSAAATRSALAPSSP